MKKLSSCKNLGPTIIQNLSLIGITSFDDLSHHGPVKIYNRLQANFPDRTWPICYYLYSLEGALTDTHWDDIPESRKEQLKDEAGITG